MKKTNLFAIAAIAVGLSLISTSSAHANPTMSRTATSTDQHAQGQIDPNHPRWVWAWADTGWDATVHVRNSHGDQWDAQISSEGVEGRRAYQQTYTAPFDVVAVQACSSRPKDNYESHCSQWLNIYGGAN
ncbi:hypothetical protein [Nocardia sp. NPDC004722]